MLDQASGMGESVKRHSALQLETVRYRGRV